MDYKPASSSQQLVRLASIWCWFQLDSPAALWVLLAHVRTQNRNPTCLPILRLFCHSGLGLWCVFVCVKSLSVYDRQTASVSVWMTACLSRRSGCASGVSLYPRLTRTSARGTANVLATCLPVAGDTQAAREAQRFSPETHCVSWKTRWGFWRGESRGRDGWRHWWRKKGTETLVWFLKRS